MAVITIHPKNNEEASLFEYLAKRLNTPYEIRREKKEDLKKKPSDFFGSLREEEGEKLQDFVRKSREEWQRDI